MQFELKITDLDFEFELWICWAFANLEIHRTSASDQTPISFISDFKAKWESWLHFEAIFEHILDAKEDYLHMETLIISFFLIFWSVDLTCIFVLFVYQQDCFWSPMVSLGFIFWIHVILNDFSLFFFLITFLCFVSPRSWDRTRWRQKKLCWDCPLSLWWDRVTEVLISLVRGLWIVCLICLA